ncbi:MAG: xanthine dehydrogenase family protein molybdopterin-binding subunit, partial [Rhodospirillaceae bacterium]|nr:xanthine dehydrogenase family protein molybdopterin-binding subunit [Rhodospirillaceae bacterium]
MTEQGIGAAVARREDRRFVTGQGHYTDDINRRGQTHACFVRSPHAHATLNGVDTAAAAAMPGVRAIFVGEDMAEVGPLICGWAITDVHGEPFRAPPHPALAIGKVNYAGEAVAVVIADTLEQAKDAAAAVEVDYGLLDAVVDPAQATADGQPQIHEAAPGNLSFEWALGDKAAVDAVFDGAAHVTSLEFANNRLVPNAMEPRACVAEYDAGSGEHTLHIASQNPHVHRLVMSAFHGLAPEHKLRVVAPDVGGGFGSKIFIYAEEVVLTWAASRVRRPIKWTAERSESFLTDAHGRDHATTAELALDSDGKFLAMRVDTTANMGAYLSTFASAVPTYLYATLLAGQYTTGGIYCNVKAVFTNTVPVDAYRGAGRPEAAYVVERLVEAAAAETGRDPAELRKTNFVPADAFPYETPVIMQYDCGDFAGSMDQALDLAGYNGFQARKAESKAGGKLRGIGFS